MEVGDLISFYRKQSGLTIDELAEKSGVPKGTLNKIIGGITKAPTLDNMKAIARALGKTLADFDDSPIIANKKSPANLPVDEARAWAIAAIDQLSDEDFEALAPILKRLQDKRKCT